MIVTRLGCIAAAITRWMLGAGVLAAEPPRATVGVPAFQPLGGSAPTGGAEQGMMVVRAPAIRLAADGARPEGHGTDPRTNWRSSRTWAGGPQDEDPQGLGGAGT